MKNLCSLSKAQLNLAIIIVVSAIALVTGLLVLLNALSTGISETMIRAATTLSSSQSLPSYNGAAAKKPAR